MITIKIEMDDYYSGGWLYTDNNSYYFDSSTDMPALVRMIIGDENDVGTD